jgi:hypothetical protein
VRYDSLRQYVYLFDVLVKYHLYIFRKLQTQCYLIQNRKTCDQSEKDYLMVKEHPYLIYKFADCTGSWVFEVVKMFSAEDQATMEE